jgi:hypothetical protein
LATVQWTRNDAKYGVISLTATLNGGDVSADLMVPDYADKTIHVFGGTFGSSQVDVLGLNSTEGTGQSLHRVNDPSLTFSGIASETLALLLENPAIIRASATVGTGTGLKVIIVGKRNL